MAKFQLLALVVRTVIWTSPRAVIARLETQGSGLATPAARHAPIGEEPFLEMATEVSTPSEGSRVKTRVMGLLASAGGGGEIEMSTCCPTKVKPDGGP